MHKSSVTIATIWWKRNWWSIGEIARRRWSINSCRHIFALRQKVKKNHSVLFSSWHVVCQRYSLYVYIFQSFDWYGLVVWRYHDHRHHHHVPFFSPSLSIVSTSSLRFFLCSSTMSLLQSDNVRWTYIQLYIYVKKYVFLLHASMSLRDSRYVFIRGSNVVMCTIE